MRHQVAGYKLGRSKGARTALRRTLIRQFFTHERITTTRTKAEAIRGDAERMITVARRSADAADSAKVAARRLVLSRLGGGQLHRSHLRASQPKCECGKVNAAARAVDRTR